MLSVIVITKNEERNIERCLRSVQWAPEIVVVDAESTDNTCKAALQFGAKVITRTWEGYSAQKEFALRHASHPWALSLDADEEVTPELREEIQAVIGSAEANDGYEISRKSYFLGKWIQHCGWYPGYQLRLMKKTKARIHHRPVHEGFMVEGSIGRLSGSINHYSYRSLHHYIEKMNEYSSLDVANKFSAGKKIRWFNFLLNPLSAFVRMYFSLQGYKEGMHGFLLASYSALHVMVIYAKTWEYQFALLHTLSPPPITSKAIMERKKLST